MTLRLTFLACALATLTVAHILDKCSAGMAGVQTGEVELRP